MRLVSVGTTPILLFNPNSKRVKIKIQMQSTSVDSANTGKVFVGIGFQPTATVAAPLQGEILMQGAYIERPSGGDVITERERGVIWAVADTASQSLVIEEMLTED